MRCQPARAAAASMLCALLVAATPVISLVEFASTANAQTLTAPDAPRKWMPRDGRKSRASAHVKSCSNYGAGFVNVAGTDACVKIGGWVTIEGTAR